MDEMNTDGPAELNPRWRPGGATFFRLGPALGLLLALGCSPLPSSLPGGGGGGGGKDAGSSPDGGADGGFGRGDGGLSDPCSVAGSWISQCPGGSCTCSTCGFSTFSSSYTISPAIAAQGGSWTEVDGTNYVFGVSGCTLTKSFAASSPCFTGTRTYSETLSGGYGTYNHAFTCWTGGTCNCTGTTTCTDTRTSQWAVTNLTATPGSGSVTLDWSFTGANILSFEIDYAEVSGVCWDNYSCLTGGGTVSTSQPPFTVTGLAHAATYHFVVRTYPGGAQSSEATATTQ